MPRLFRHPPYNPLVSHQFPCTVWLPGSSLALTIYPAALEVVGGIEARFLIDPECRFLEHTTRLNLLDYSVTIEGMTPRGFQRLEIKQGLGGWFLETKKIDLQGIWEGKGCVVVKKNHLVIAKTSLFSALNEKPRLVLSSPNNSNWDTLLKEKKWATLLEQLYLVDSIPGAEHTFENISEILSKGFSGMVVPRVGHEISTLFGQSFWRETSFLSNLSAFRSFLRSFFIQEKGNRLLFLPKVLPGFLAGQLLDETAFKGALGISYDWRKERVRRVLLTPREDIQCALDIPGASSARLRILGNKVVSQETLGQVRTFKKDKRYLLDNFVQ